MVLLGTVNMPTMRRTQKSGGAALWRVYYADRTRFPEHGHELREGPSARVVT
jgi:hypothetical protein